MEHKDIKFKTTTDAYYHGRNGTGYCVGLFVSAYSKERITIMPMNTKGVANCSIDIPKDVETLQEIINILREAQNEIEQRNCPQAA